MSPEVLKSKRQLLFLTFLSSLGNKKPEVHFRTNGQPQPSRSTLCVFVADSLCGFYLSFPKCSSHVQIHVWELAVASRAIHMTANLAKISTLWYSRLKLQLLEWQNCQGCQLWSLLAGSVFAVCFYTLQRTSKSTVAMLRVACLQQKGSSVWRGKALKSSLKSVRSTPKGNTKGKRLLVIMEHRLSSSIWRWICFNAATDFEIKYLFQLQVMIRSYATIFQTPDLTCSTCRHFCWLWIQGLQARPTAFYPG